MNIAKYMREALDLARQGAALAARIRSWAQSSSAGMRSSVAVPIAGMA